MHQCVSQHAYYCRNPCMHGRQRGGRPVQQLGILTSKHAGPPCVLGHGDHHDFVGSLGSIPMPTRGSKFFECKYITKSSNNSSRQQDPSLVVESSFLLLGFRFLKSWSSLLFTCLNRFHGLVWRPVRRSSLVFSLVFSSWEFFILLLVVCK